MSFITYNLICLWWSIVSLFQKVIIKNTGPHKKSLHPKPDMDLPGTFFPDPGYRILPRGLFR